jgi:hypothetical protein
MRKNKKLDNIIDINATMNGKLANLNIMNKHLIAADSVVAALRVISRNTRYESEVDDILEEAEKYLYDDGGVK